MVFLINFDGKDILFTWGLFGVQLDHSNDEKKKLISKLHQLLNQSAGRVEIVLDESHDLERQDPTSIIFIAYWLDCKDYKAWNEGIFLPFWDGLPDDAGFWREVMTVPKSRFMSSTSLPEPTGPASLVGTKPSTDMGYWGVYRQRMYASPDQHTLPGDSFTSSYTSRCSSNPNPAQKLVDLEREYPDSIHKGRIKITKVPDNFCFIREVQGQSNLPKEELDTWLKSLNPYFRSWVDHLTTHHNDNGIVSFSTHLAAEAIPKSTTRPGSEVVACPEANQLMYFLDLSNFERAGRANKDHVKLRALTMSLHGPGGKFFKYGKLNLSAEMRVLKPQDLEAEYIGCKEGTRLMILQDL